jgi:adenylate kinase
MLADELGLPWLSTGEFLRMLISGKRRKEMLHGKLLDDEHMISLVQKIFSLIDTSEEFVMDGFPRTVAQTDWLLNQVKHGQLRITAIVHLIASREVVFDRLLQRARPDDHEQAIDERFREYETTTLPMLEHFKQARIPIYEIDGQQDIQQVHQATTDAFKS